MTNLAIVAMTSAERKAKQRAAAVAAGRCIVCCRRKAMPKKTVCRPCNEEAKARVRESRSGS